MHKSIKISYHAAMVLQKHIMSKNPIQLNRKDVVKAVKKTKSLPSKVVSVISPFTSVSGPSNGRVSKVNPGKWPLMRRPPPLLTSNSSLLDSDSWTPTWLGSNFPSEIKFFMNIVYYILFRFHFFHSLKTPQNNFSRVENNNYW